MMTISKGEGDDDDVCDNVEHAIGERPKLEKETENMGICKKERKGITAEVLVAHRDDDVYYRQCCITHGSKQEREGWVLLKIPRGDIDGVGEVKL